MSTTFHCPKCGAPQDYQGGSAATIQCPYCEAALIVPPELRTGASSAGASSGLSAEQAAAVAEIKRLLNANQKIQAIKVFRQVFGGGLKQAKDAVEAIERGQEVKPGRTNVIGSMNGITITGTGDNLQVTVGNQVVQSGNPGAQSRNSGCANTVIVVVVLIVAAFIILPFVMMGSDLFGFISGALQPTPTTISQQIPTKAPMATIAPTSTAIPTPQFASAVHSFSKKGIAPGELNDARYIAADGKENIYVGEYSGARIQRFDAQGKFRDQWGLNAKQELDGMTADLRGNLYAVINHMITKFDGATGKRLSQYQYDVPGDGFGEIATMPDGGLVGMWYEQPNGILTSVKGHREDLVRFDRDGNVTQTTQGIISNQTDDVEYDNLIATDPKGNIYLVSRQAEGTIFKFSPEGKLITRFGSRGNDPGQLNTTYSIAADNKGRVYIGKSDGIMVFSGDGRYIDVFDNNREDAGSMAFDGQDSLWVLSHDKITEYKLNKP